MKPERNPWTASSLLFWFEQQRRAQCFEQFLHR
jgi:hypothetical protein